MPHAKITSTFEVVGSDRGACRARPVHLPQFLRRLPAERVRLRFVHSPSPSAAAATRPLTGSLRVKNTISLRRSVSLAAVRIRDRRLQGLALSAPHARCFRAASYTRGSTRPGTSQPLRRERSRYPPTPPCPARPSASLRVVQFFTFAQVCTLPRTTNPPGP
jgi:hypothetical protein